MKSTYEFLLVAVLMTINVSAAPYVGYVYPAGIARGETKTLIVGGQGFYGKLATEVTGGGIRVISERTVPLSGPPTTSQRKWLGDWLIRLENGITNAPPLPTDPAARIDEWTSNRWWRTLHQLSPLERRLVAHAVYERPNVLQASPSIRQMRLVTITADACATCGVRSLVMYDTKWGQLSAPRPFFVTKTRHVVEPNYAPSAWIKAVTNVEFQAERKCLVDAGRGIFLDGRVEPGETDRFRVWLTHGRWRYRVFASSLQPIIGDAVPGYFNAMIEVEGVKLQPSAQLKSHDPEGMFSIAKDGEYAISVRDVLFRGRSDFVYSLALFREGEELSEFAAFGQSDPFLLRFDPKSGELEGEMKSPFMLFSRQSSLGGKGGQWKSVQLIVKRLPDFDAPIAIVENEHFEIRNGYIPAGTNFWRLTVLPKCKQAGSCIETDLRAVAFGKDGQIAVSKIIPADEYEQAFAWKHLLPQAHFIFKPLK